MTDVTLHIEGMSCSHCLNAVSRALHGVDGVEVRSIKIGRAEVAVPGPAEVAALVEAVQNAGYRATAAAGK